MIGHGSHPRCRLRHALLQPGRARLHVLYQHVLHLRTRCRRDARPPLLLLVAFLALVVASSIGMSAYYNSSYVGRWPWYVVFGIGWAAGTAGLAFAAKQQLAHAQDVRRAAHAVAAGHVRAHQPLPDGLARVPGLHAIRLHGGHARLLLALRRGALIGRRRRRGREYRAGKD